jgi:hypothetical protein
MTEPSAVEYQTVIISERDYVFRQVRGDLWGYYLRETELLVGDEEARWSHMKQRFDTKIATLLSQGWELRGPCNILDRHLVQGLSKKF